MTLAATGSPLTWRDEPARWRAEVARRDGPDEPPARVWAAVDCLQQELLRRRSASNGGLLAVAYSGGVDSAVLIALALQALGQQSVLAVLANSQSLARRELRMARRVADDMGATLVELTTHEMDKPDYRANGVDRCYFCKEELFARIGDQLPHQWDVFAVAYGENADDAMRPDRPGSRAAREADVLRPLADHGLGKQAVRQLARVMGLRVADKPAAPCLASRIPHGDEVTAAKLEQIDHAEDVVLAAGFSDCRVRHHGEVARIEIPLGEFHLLPEVRDQVLQGVRQAGFSFVAVDLAGIQSGAFTVPLLQVGRRD